MLSVVIPCYNDGEFLIKLLDCCLRQNYKDWEVIIVDDGSTDNTISLAKAFCEKDKRFTFLCRDRLPFNGDTCRNIGFEAAKGEYIVFFDADDLISDTCFEKRVAEMECNPDIDYISFPAKCFFDENNLPPFEKEGKTWGIGNAEEDLKSLLSANYSFTVWCNIYRTDSLRRAGIFWDEKVLVYQDFDFMLQGVQKGLKHKFSELKELTYYYRMRKGSVSKNCIEDEKCDSTIYLFQKVLNNLQNNNQQEEIKYFLNHINIHFERLVYKNNDERINQYLELVQKFYGKKRKNKLLHFYRTFKFYSLLFSQNHSLMLTKREYKKLWKLGIKKLKSII